MRSEAKHTNIGLRYALKLLPADFAKRSDSLKMFKSEARVMANMQTKTLFFILILQPLSETSSFNPYAKVA